MLCITILQSSSDLFFTWSHEALEYISRLCQLSNWIVIFVSTCIAPNVAAYSPKSTVFQEGEPSNDIFVLVKGK